MNYLTKEALDHFIAEALREDIGDGDHTSLSCIPENERGAAQLYVKDEGVLAGVELARMIFQYVDPEIELDFFKTDGEKVKFGEKGFSVRGKIQDILKTERLVLNCMQRMSGIATSTHKMNT